MAYELNREQLRAVNSDMRKLICLAGAGTGKTRTLIERIVRLVRQGVDPKSILALTFTNAAAFEMKSRFREYISDGESPEFRTFHSYCYELMSIDKNIRSAFGYTAVPEIADENLRKKISKEAIMQSGIKFTKKQLEDPNLLNSLDKTNLRILEKCTSRIMRKENVITFDKLCTSICKLFIEDSPLITKYKNQIKYLHVDEYQDTDKIQHEFVMSFSNSASIFIVGDILQNLYSFRGTTSSILKKLSMDNEWDVIKLSKNYRSTKQICDFANKFSKTYADEYYRIPLESIREGRDVELRDYDSYTTSQKYAYIFDRIAFECKNVINGSVAILARTNSECRSIQKELDRNGVQYSTNNRQLDIKYILPSVLDSKFLINWLATFLPSNQYSEFIRMYAKYSVESTGYTEKTFLQNFGLNKDIEVRMESIYELRNIINSKRTAESKCKAILQTIGYPSLSVKTFDDMDNEALLSEISSAIDSCKHQESSVYVGTIHSVKGLEFDVVYVMGVDGYKFKLDSEDNKNVYYVAITRAKNNLIIYS